MQSSYFLEDRRKPLNPNNACLNDSLQTQHLDVDERDESFVANATRTISKTVGRCFTPRQVLGLLRVLKAITLAFLVLSILSNVMYIIFVEWTSSSEVREMAGGRRDVILRFYGVWLSLAGLAIELDYSKVVKKFSGLKGFLPRALLYLFLSTITAPNPLLLIYDASKNSSSGADQNGDNGNGDDAAGDDAAAGGDEYDYAADYSAADLQIPNSAVGFQRVTSFVMVCCAFAYFICGLLCFDRFTARAFLSSKVATVETAIPAAQAPPLSGPISSDESATQGSDSAPGDRA